MQDVSSFIKKYKIVIISSVLSAILIIGIVFGIALSKENKTYKSVVTQMEDLSQNIIRAYQIKPTYWGLSTNEVINKKLYPENMKVKNNKLIGYFGNEVEIGSDENGTTVMPSEKNFVIAYKGLTNKQCIGTGAQKFNNNFWLSVKKITIQNHKFSQDFIWGGQDNALPPSKKNLEKACGLKNNIIIHL